MNTSLNDWLSERGTAPIEKGEVLPQELIDTINASPAGLIEIVGKKFASYNQPDYEVYLRAGLKSQMGELFSLMVDEREYRVKTQWIENPSQEAGIEKEIVLFARVLVNPAQAKIGDFAWMPDEHEAHRFIEFPQDVWLCVA